MDQASREHQHKADKKSHEPEYRILSKLENGDSSRLVDLLLVNSESDLADAEKDDEDIDLLLLEDVREASHTTEFLVPNESLTILHCKSMNRNPLRSMWQFSRENSKPAALKKERSTYASKS
jgi:hypothetical protein